MKKTIIRSTALLMLLTLIGKLIGFLRSSVLASIFGATAGTDQLYIASGFMSNVVYALMTALSVALLPVYLGVKEKNGEEEASVFASRIIGKLTVLAVLIGILIAVAAPVLTTITAPSYSQEARQSVILYYRILSIGVLFSLTTRMMTSLLDAERRYGFGALCGILYSLIEIGVVLAFHKSLGVISICISVPIAYAFQNLFLSVYSRRTIKLRRIFDADFSDENLKLLVLTAIPVLLSNSVQELNQLVDRLLASSAVTGGVTALNYGAVLYQFVAALISGSLITVMFTELSTSIEAGDLESEKKLYNNGVTSILMILVPITLISFICANDVVKIAYGRGAFDGDDVKLTALVLSMYILDLAPNAIKTLSTRVFYAHKDTKTPMILGIISVGINIVASITLSRVIGFLGILVGTVLSAYLSMLLQSIVVNKRYALFKFSLMKKTLLKIAAASIVCLFVVITCNALLTQFSCYLRFAVVSAVSLSIFVAVLFALKTQELTSLASKLSRSKRKNA